MEHLNEIAEKIFKVVENDLRYRIGIGDEWGRADLRTVIEIRSTNITKILEVLQKSLADK